VTVVDFQAEVLLFEMIRGFCIEISTFTSESPRKFINKKNLRSVIPKPNANLVTVLRNPPIFHKKIFVDYNFLIVIV
jgi:hypothetical protein